MLNTPSLTTNISCFEGKCPLGAPFQRVRPGNTTIVNFVFQVDVVHVDLIVNVVQSVTHRHTNIWNSRAAVAAKTET